MLSQIRVFSQATSCSSNCDGFERTTTKECLSSSTKFMDQVLCRYAQLGCKAAEERLWQNNCLFIRNLALRQIRCYGLSSQEVSDAIQESYFAFHEAVAQFHPENYCTERSASFKTFLHVIVRRKLSNYCLRRRNYLKHILTDSDGEILQNCVEECKSGAYNNGDAPGAFFEGLLKCLQEYDCANDSSYDRFLLVLYKLKPKEKLLLDTWLRYGRDREVGHILGITEIAAKLRRERLFRRMKDFCK